jgi:hypothetical protein
VPPPDEDPGARDLHRILRYDSAVDDAGELFEVAPEMYLLPFWTPDRLFAHVEDD